MDVGPHSEPRMDEDPPTPAHAFRELRPARRLRFWQKAPIGVVAVLGSLMFAFPLAFNGGASDLLVAFCGLLITLGAGCWGGLVAYRAGHTWPGLRGRVAARARVWPAALGYALLFAALTALVAWRLVVLAH